MMLVFLLTLLVMKALDKDGKKIFKLEDKMDLMTKVDSDVLSTDSNSYGTSYQLLMK